MSGINRDLAYREMGQVAVSDKIKVPDIPENRREMNSD